LPQATLDARAREGHGRPDIRLWRAALPAMVGSC
jgi:hypothetical protein